MKKIQDLAARREQWYRKKYNALAAPFKYITVHSKDVNYLCEFHQKTRRLKGSKMYDFGRIIPGDWDQNMSKNPFSKRIVYKAVFERINHSKSWEETGILDHKMSVIEKRGVIDHCRTYDELVARYNKLDTIIDTIQKEGKLRKQSELPNGKLGSEMSVSIGRDGEMLLASGGHHRLAIAKALHLPVEFLVLSRHKKWQDLREKVYNEKRSGINHPDLEDILLNGK